MVDAGVPRRRSGSMAEHEYPAESGGNLNADEVPLQPQLDTFCTHPWIHMRLQPDGEVKLCCHYTGGNIAKDGLPMSLQHQALAEIWNSEAMRSIRRDMVEGRRISGCEQCYKDEDR